MLEIPESWDTCIGELLTGHRTSSREISVLQTIKMKGDENLKSVLTSDREIQSLDISKLVFGLVLVQYVLARDICLGF